MKVSGFSFVRNAQIYDYPVVESLLSLLPICDEVIVAVGKSDDDTLALIHRINSPKLKIVETIWDESLREGGQILAHQTNFALSHCTGDWCFYLQADEVIHESDYDLISNDIRSANSQKGADALLFRYLHFYGSYDFIGKGRQWYRREIRCLRNTKNMISWGDAQGFRQKSESGNFDLVRAKQTEARIFHYGWVKPPDAQQRKQKYFNKLWHDDDWVAENVSLGDFFDYSSAFEVEKYSGSHPEIMEKRVSLSKIWTKHFDPLKLKKKPFRIKILDAIESKTDRRIGEFRDFKEV